MSPIRVPWRCRQNPQCFARKITTQCVTSRASLTAPCHATERGMLYQTEHGKLDTRQAPSQRFKLYAVKCAWCVEDFGNARCEQRAPRTRI